MSGRSSCFARVPHWSVFFNQEQVRGAIHCLASSLPASRSVTRRGCLNFCFLFLILGLLVSGHSAFS